MLFGCFGLGGGEAAEAGSGRQQEQRRDQEREGGKGGAAHAQRDGAAAVADAGRPVAYAGLVGAACLHAARELHGGEGGRED